jgi:hypothetical protein
MKQIKVIADADFFSNGGRLIDYKVIHDVSENPFASDSINRQRITVFIIVDGNRNNCHSGEAYLNPNDLYDEDKGIKVATASAMRGIQDKKVRADLWESINRFLLFTKVLDPYLNTYLFESEYGEKTLQKMFSEVKFATE